MGEAIMVGLAEIKFTQSPDDVLIALGLGSCISVCAYDAQASVAAGARCGGFVALGAIVSYAAIMPRLVEHSKSKSKIS